MAAIFRLFGGQISLLAVCKLNKEGLLGMAARSDLVTVIEEQLKGICGDRYGTKLEDMNLGFDYIVFFLKLGALEYARCTCSAAMSLKSTSPSLSRR